MIGEMSGEMVVEIHFAYIVNIVCLYGIDVIITSLMRYLVVVIAQQSLFLNVSTCQTEVAFDSSTRGAHGVVLCNTCDVFRAVLLLAAFIWSEI
jgi:hypothetical protein